MAIENAPTPEKIKLLKNLRAAAHADWVARYRVARKSHGWCYHLHLEVFEDEDGCWARRIWDTVTEKLSHNGTASPDQETSKAHLVDVGRAYLITEYPARSFPAADIQWLESTGPDSDPTYFLTA